jgi:hypothetical protein
MIPQNTVTDGAAAYTEGNIVRMLTVLGADVGGFTLREIGFYDEDNDLIAVASVPATEKVVSSSGTDFKLRILCNLIVDNADTIQIVVNPTLNTVDNEQLEAVVQNLEVQFNGDIASHNADPQAHDAIQQAIADAVSEAESRIALKLMPKQYGATSGGNYACYTLYPDGTAIGYGFTNDMNSNGDIVSIPSCGKTFSMLKVVHAYTHSGESVNNLSASVSGIGQLSPTVKLEHNYPFGSTTAHFSFYGRVNM